MGGEDHSGSPAISRCLPNRWRCSGSLKACRSAKARAELGLSASSASATWRASLTGRWPLGSRRGSAGCRRSAGCGRHRTAVPQDGVVEVAGGVARDPHRAVAEEDVVIVGRQSQPDVGPPPRLARLADVAEGERCCAPRRRPSWGWRRAPDRTARSPGRSRGTARSGCGPRATGPADRSGRAPAQPGSAVRPRGCRPQDRAICPV